MTREEELLKQIKDLKEKNKSLVDIVTQLFFMSPMKRDLCIEVMKRIVIENKEEDMSKIFSDEPKVYNYIKEELKKKLM